MSTLPFSPFHGQIFIDAQRIKWQWDANLDSWQHIGFVDALPIATIDTVGLLDSQLKQTLDAVPVGGGGFGFITQVKPDLYNSKLDSIVTGDIELLSESLIFTPVNQNGIEITEAFNYIAQDVEDEVKVGFSITIDPIFLDNLCVEFVGYQGPDGDKGPKGLSGKDGYNNSPAGPKGDKGLDAAVFHKFTGIKFVDVDTVYDEAIVGLEYDSATSTFTISNAKMNVPNDDNPAEQFMALPTVRDIVFTIENDECYTTLDNWILTVPSGDPLADSPDLYVFSYPGAAETGDSVAATPILLSDYISKIVEFYKDKLDEFDDQWQKQAKDLITAKDAAARQALSNVATKLADCEFQKPIQFCMGIDMPSVPPSESPESIDVLPSPGVIQVLRKAVIVAIYDETQNNYFINPTMYENDKVSWDLLINNLKAQGIYHIKAGIIQPQDGQYTPADLLCEGCQFPEDTEGQIKVVEFDDTGVSQADRVSPSRIVSGFDEISGGSSYDPTLCVFILDNSGSLKIDVNYGGPRPSPDSDPPHLALGKSLLLAKYPNLQFLTNIETSNKEDWLRAMTTAISTIINSGGI